MHPFHKWVLCGVNGSCTELNPLIFIQGGAVGKASFTGISRFAQYWGIHDASQDSYGYTNTSVERIDNQTKAGSALHLPNYNEGLFLVGVDVLCLKS